MKFKFQKIGELPEIILTQPLGKTLKGSQAPTPLLMEDRVKLYFTSRDVGNKSHCLSIELDKNIPLIITSANPTLEFEPSSELGWYYSDGYMISQVLNKHINLFTGWEYLADDYRVRYRTSCGATFNKVSKRDPDIDRTFVGPCGSSMPFLDITTDITYFMAIEKWHLGESYYHIASKNRNTGAIKSEITLQEGEGGLARPVIFNIGSNKFMMFSSRGTTRFRDSKDESYKLVIAKKEEEGWTRIQEVAIENAEDDLMQAYGYPIEINNSWYLFYNNHFQSSIQIAQMTYE